MWQRIHVGNINWARWILGHPCKSVNKISRKHAAGVRESEKYNVGQLQTCFGQARPATSRWRNNLAFRYRKALVPPPPSPSPSARALPQTGCMPAEPHLYALLPRFYLARPLISRTVAQIVQRTNPAVVFHTTRASLPHLHLR